MVGGWLSEPILEVILSPVYPSLHLLHTDYITPDLFSPLESSALAVVRQVASSAPVVEIVVDLCLLGVRVLPWGRIDKDPWLLTGKNLVIKIGSYGELDGILLKVSALLASINSCPPVALQLRGSAWGPGATQPSMPRVIEEGVLDNLPTLRYIKIHSESPVDRKSLWDKLATPLGPEWSWPCPDLRMLDLGEYGGDELKEFLQRRWGTCDDGELSGLKCPQKLDELISGLGDDAVVNHATGKCSCAS